MHFSGLFRLFSLQISFVCFDFSSGISEQLILKSHNLPIEIKLLDGFFRKVKSAFYLPCLVKIAQYTLEFKSFHVTALEKREESFIKNSKV